MQSRNADAFQFDAKLYSHLKVFRSTNFWCDSFSGESTRLHEYMNLIDNANISLSCRKIYLWWIHGELSFSLSTTKIGVLASCYFWARTLCWRGCVIFRLNFAFIRGPENSHQNRKKASSPWWCSRYLFFSLSKYQGWNAKVLLQLKGNLEKMAKIRK